jgi:CheY-like chemotaxis protein
MQMGALVLVVDDDADIRRVLHLILEFAGYTAVLASNGVEAIERVTEQTPALVLLDLNMPMVSGWDVHDELRRRRLGIPVVFMTAAESAWVQAEQHGAQGALPKPFDIDDVLSTVARFVA